MARLDAAQELRIAALNASIAMDKEGNMTVDQIVTRAAHISLWISDGVLPKVDWQWSASGQPPGVEQ